MFPTECSGKNGERNYSLGYIDVQRKLKVFSLSCHFFFPLSLVSTSIDEIEYSLVRTGEHYDIEFFKI